jgi:Anti-sigma-K factor rskA
VSGEHDLDNPQDGCCGDAAIYLLGLLDERHSSAFLEHARFCSVCSDELDALAPAVDRLAVTIPRLPAPGHVKQQVMKVVRAEAAQASSRAPRARRWRGLLPRRPALALAGAVLLAAGVAIGGLSTPFGGVSTRGGAPTGRAVSADVTLAGAKATLHQSNGHTWLTVSQMPEPSSGHVYEVWVKYPEHALPRPTDSLFTPTAAGTATVAVPYGTGASEVLVTQEPSGGSSLPTSSPVIVAHLS